MNKSQHERAFALAEVVILLVAVAIIGFIGYGLKNFRGRPPAISDGTTVHGVRLKYISLPVLKDYTKGDIFSTQVAGGHYLYAFLVKNELCSACAFPFTGKGYVVYDGKKVFNGMVDGGSLALSGNGRHYSYAAMNTSNSTVSSVYVDNAYVMPANGESPVVAVGDTGNYAYTASNSLYVVSKTIYSSPDADSLISGPVFDAALANYITGVDTSTETADGVRSSVIYNGKTLNSAAESGRYENGISRNGQHTIYTTEGEVYLDNRKVYSAPNADVRVTNLVVTDTGRYAFLACDLKSNAATVYIYSQATANGQCLQSGTAGTLYGDTFTSAVFSADSTHYFYFYGNQQADKAVLDGKPLTLSGRIVGADFSGNDLTLYRYTD